jgi:hypothetical protein
MAELIAEAKKLRFRVDCLADTENVFTSMVSEHPEVRSAPIVLFCGSDRWTLSSVTERVVRDARDADGNLIVLVGDRRGAERSVIRACQKLEVPYAVFPTFWRQGIEANNRDFNPVAVHARNSLMLMAQPHYTVALCSDLESAPELRDFTAKAYAAGQRVHQVDRHGSAIDYQRADDPPLSWLMLRDDAASFYDVGDVVV